MKNIIIYYSETGNTEALANKIYEALEDVEIYKSAEVQRSNILEASNIILGCPALGAEELDDSMKELSSYINSKIKNQRIFLFGSYGWGDGEWMRTWESEMTNFTKSLVCNEDISNLDDAEYMDFVEKIRQD